MEDIDPSFFLDCLKSNNIDEILTGIFTLSEIMESGGSSALKKIQYNDIYLSLINILCSQKNEELLNNTTRCIVLSDSFINSIKNFKINIENPSQILQSIFNHLSDTSFKDLTKIHILNALFHMIPICQNQNTIFDFSPFPLFDTINKYVNKFDFPTERFFSKFMLHLWSFYGQFENLEKYRKSLFDRVESVTFLYSLQQNGKLKTSEALDNICRLIFKIMSTYHVIFEVVECLNFIIAYLKKANESEMKEILQLLNYCKLLYNLEISYFNFVNIFQMSDSKVFIETFMIFTISFLPKPNIPSIEELFDKELFQWTTEQENGMLITLLCQQMIEIITNLYEKQNNSLNLFLLKSLAVFTTYFQYSPSDSMLYHLISEAKDEKYAFYVAIIISHMSLEKKKLIFRTDVFNTLQSIQFESETLNSSYIEFLNKNLQHEEFVLPDEVLYPESLSDICSAIKTGKLLFFDFLNESNDLFNVIWENLLSSRKEDLQTLVDFIFNQGLPYLPLPKPPSDPISYLDYTDYLEKSIPFKCNFKNINVEFYAPILYSEMIFNDKDFENVVQTQATTSPEMLKMFHDFDQVFHARYSMAVIAQEIKVKGFKFYTYKIDNKWVTPYEYSLKAMLDIVDNPSDLLKLKKFEIYQVSDPNKSSLQMKSSYLHKINERMNKNNPIQDMDQLVQNIFELLNEIYLQDQSINMINNTFLNRILHQLSSPILTIGVFSPCTKLMMKYPFLFSFNDRFFIYKVLTSELPFVINLYLQRFKKENPVNKPSHTWHMKVTRNNLFEEGMIILKKFGKYKIFLEFSFENETGVGTGPNREFFRLMSREFCLKERGLWRTNETNNEYAHTEKGLFPICTANEELFYSFGIFVAKALQMDIMLDIPFNPSFFDLILGRTIELSDVDEKYSAHFADPKSLYGLSFVYPIHGQDGIEMIPDGENIDVNEENVNEYIKLFTEFTIGKKIESQINAFRNGFNEIMDINALGIFTGNEINRIICGDDFELTQEALQKYVKIGSGFGPNSDQIKFLFEIILEMDYNEKNLFLQFITGSSRLPIGGLAAIHPPLTVARRVLDSPEMTNDDPLPTVLTCTHYFKLPAYSTKQIMKEKLMKAVMEGRENFTQS